MSRTPLLLGVALLAVAALSVGGAGSVVDSDAAGALPDGEPVRVENVSNTTNYLVPDGDIERRTYVTANVDVGSAVDASAAALDSEHRRLTYEERLASQTDDSDGRLAVAERELADAEARMERLDARQESVFRAYSNGTLTRQQFVRHLVRLEVRATAYSEYLDTLEQETDRRLETPPSNFDTRISQLRAQTVALPDPVTGRIADAVLGVSDPFVLYSEGVDDALVLAAVDDGAFYRQATLRNAYRPDEPNTLTLEGALQRATELYPWVYSGGQGFEPQIGIASAGLFEVSATHPQGRLASYISGSTADVFHETQTLDPQTLPVYKTATNGTDSLNLSVTTTTQTGPMRVELTTPAGTPVNGTVLVDGEPVDTTGDDGTLWTVRPSGTFKLSVVSESGAEVSLSRIRFLRTS